MEHLATNDNGQAGSDISAQMMTGVINPFTFTLENDGSSSNLTDGANVTISSQVPCILQAFWGVSIKDVYDEAYQHWQTFHQQFMYDILFKEISLVMGDKVFIDCCINKTI